MERRDARYESRDEGYGAKARWNCSDVRKDVDACAGDLPRGAGALGTLPVGARYLLFLVGFDRGSVVTAGHFLQSAVYFDPTV